MADKGGTQSTTPAGPSTTQPLPSSHPNSASQANGASNPDTAPATTADAPALTGAQLKAQKKAEKAAKRAAAKPTGPPPDSPSMSKQTAHSQSQPQPQPQNKQRRPSLAASRAEQQLPTRNRPAATATPTPQEPKRENKQVSLFSHLYTQPRRYTLDGIPREVHPAVQSLGLQSSNYCICGSHARCVAMLLALRCVVQSYDTPPDQTLNRHLNSQHLSPQLSFLKSCRPFSVSQANAVRWLKNVIAKIDPSTPELQAKQEICRAIDTFIRERLTVADQVIADAVCESIEDGDIIATYARSAVVAQSLITAKQAGKKFKVIVIDSKPLFEGKSLVQVLVDAGIDVSYSLLNGASHALRKVTKCLIGAHAILGNGRIYSRAGTALTSMIARQNGAVILACAESIKFTERVALDSIVMNELAPEDELILEDEEESDEEKGAGLACWRERERLQLLNPLFDVTPAEFVDVIVTELGSIHPASAPVVQRMSAGAQEGEPMLV